MKNGWMECCQLPLGPAELHLKPESAQGQAVVFDGCTCSASLHATSSPTHPCFALMLSVNVHKTRRATALTCVGPLLHRFTEMILHAKQTSHVIAAQVTVGACSPERA